MTKRTITPEKNIFIIISNNKIYYGCLAVAATLLDIIYSQYIMKFVQHVGTMSSSGF